MKTSIKKSELLPAMKKILQEYKNVSHKKRVTSCKLCKLYYVCYGNCSICPMTVFNITGYSQFYCTNRQCRPVDCEIFYHKGITYPEIERVIKFYKKAIERVESMTEEQLNKENAFKFLIDIDKEVAEKYSI
jgi:hypothetical protein